MFQFKWMLGKMKGYRAVYAVALCLSVVIQSFFLTGPMIVEQIISIFISSPDALKNIENQRDLLILYRRECCRRYETSFLSVFRIRICTSLTLIQRATS